MVSVARVTTGSEKPMLYPHKEQGVCESPHLWAPLSLSSMGGGALEPENPQWNPTPTAWLAVWPPGARLALLSLPPRRRLRCLACSNQGRTHRWSLLSV